MPGWDSVLYNPIAGLASQNPIRHAFLSGIAMSPSILSVRDWLRLQTTKKRTNDWMIPWSKRRSSFQTVQDQGTTTPHRTRIFCGVSRCISGSIHNTVFGFLPVCPFERVQHLQAHENGYTWRRSCADCKLSCVFRIIYKTNCSLMCRLVLLSWDGGWRFSSLG